ncbi:MAG TPA: hypothetical protein VKG24_20875, partial [Pseudolabrys sp.]|nr:hypothetical protein [Pseudolabrys sp.]
PALSAREHHDRAVRVALTLSVVAESIRLCLGHHAEDRARRNQDAERHLLGRPCLLAWFGEVWQRRIAVPGWRLAVPYPYPRIFICSASSAPSGGS